MAWPECLSGYAGDIAGVWQACCRDMLGMLWEYDRHAVGIFAEIWQDYGLDMAGIW